MKLSKADLKRIIRQEKRRLNESGDIYPRPQHPMIANAASNKRLEMIELITDILENGTGLSPVACESSAEEIVSQLQKAGYC